MWPTSLDLDWAQKERREEEVWEWWRGDGGWVCASQVSEWECESVMLAWCVCMRNVRVAWVKVSESEGRSEWVSEWRLTQKMEASWPGASWLSLFRYLGEFYCLWQIDMIEGSLKVKLPTIWTDEKQSREEAERRGRLEERRVEEKE